MSADQAFSKIVMDEMTRIADELRLLEEGAGFLPLAGGGLVRVTGPGHRDVLQRVVSQDLLPLAPGGGCLALLLAPKGQFRALMAVFAGEEDTVLLAPAGRAAELAGALQKYLALSRCGAHPVPVSDSGTAVVGARWAETAAALGASAPALATGGWQRGTLGGASVSWFGRTLLGVPGAVVVGAGEEARRELREAGARSLSREAVELVRVRRGDPAWGAELTESVLPPEAGIDGETVSYSKGCYIGQETMARLKTYGHPTRALIGVRQLGGEPALPGMPSPLSEPGDDRTRGALTSWAWHPELGGVGIALVRREVAAPGKRLSGAGREFETTSFPLW